MPKKLVGVARETVHLLDGNVLVALVSPEHVHHDVAQHWFEGNADPFATCPITQGSLLRTIMNVGKLASGDARAALHHLEAHPRHRFWPDEIPYRDMAWTGVMGHRQITEAYLAGLARHFGGKLITLDRGLAALHADVTTSLLT